MKRLLFFITVSFFTINSFGQFSDTAALNTYIRDTIKDRRPEKVTAAQLQKALLGTTQFINNFSANNGITKVGSNLELGGNFSSTRTLTGSAGSKINIIGDIGIATFNEALLDVRNTASSALSSCVIKATNVNSGSGILATTIDGDALIGTSSTRNGVSGSIGSGSQYFNSSGVVGLSSNQIATNGIPMRAQIRGGAGTDNAVLTGFEILRHYGPSSPTNGSGSSFNFTFLNMKGDGIQSSTDPLNTASRIQVRMLNMFGQNQTSEMTFHGEGDSTYRELLSLHGDGNIKFSDYIGTKWDISDATGYKTVVIDSSGNIRKFNVVSQANSTIHPAYRALNNFTDSANFNTSMGCTFSGGKIVVTSGDVSFNSWLSFKDTVCSNHWRISARCSNVSVKSGNTYGFSVGMRSTNNFSKNSFGAFPNTSNDGNSGRFEFFAQANNSAFNTIFRMGAGSTVANAQNDKLIVSMERNNSTLTITVYNETTKAIAADTTITISPTSGTTIMPNAAVPTIWFHSTSGTVQVDSLYFQDFETKKADILFLGDSKTHGFGASSFTNTWPSILAQAYPNYAICAGFGDRTQDIRARLNQIIALKPKVVVAAFGSNDVREAVWSTTGQTNYKYIDSALMANGIYVLHCLPFKENSLDLTAQKDWIAANAQFTGRIIDTWTPMLEAGLLYSDGIHLNDRGNKRIATAIRTSPLLLNREIKVENVNQ